MDVTEIRHAFLATAGVASELRAWRDERLSRILADELPVPLDKERCRLVVHLVPLAGLQAVRTGALSLSTDAILNASRGLMPLRSTSAADRWTIDGFVRHVPLHDGASQGYLQIFRHGALEAVEAGVVGGGSPPALPTKMIESHVREFLVDFHHALQALQVDPPYVLFVSLLDVKGVILEEDNHRRRLYPTPIDRSVIILPEQLLETRALDLDVLTQPLFDALWQAAGHVACPRFVGGKWTQR